MSGVSIKNIRERRWSKTHERGDQPWRHDAAGGILWGRFHGLIMVRDAP